MDWLYFVATTDTGKVLSIVRRNGPTIEALGRDGEWVDGSSRFPRFLDPGYYEEVSVAEAQAAAAKIGTVWP